MKKNINKKPGSPIKEKFQDDMFDPGFSMDPYTLPEDIQKELDSKGLQARFVNMKKIMDNGGVHLRGWRPYKRDNLEKSEYAAIFGRDPDGYIRRGDSILAVKTKEQYERHKAWNAHRAQARSHKNYMKTSKQKMQDHLKSNRLQKYMKVLDGYED